jgi:hypothetical protein
MKQSLFIASLVVLMCGALTINAQTTKLPASTTTSATTTTSELVKSTETAKSAAEDLLKLEEESDTKQTASVAQLRELFNEGLIAKVELEKAEQDLADAKTKVEQTQNQIASSNQLAIEIKKAQALASVSKTQSLVKPVLKSINMIGATVMRSESGHWSLTELPQVQQFFSQSFGHLLPISTIGQSATHDRMGWDHRNSVDIGVHPDSAEGRALMSYLQTSGIPFLAFRAAIPGIATGPHIHIGFPSHRLG